MRITSYDPQTDTVEVEATYDEWMKHQEAMFDDGNRFGAMQVRLIANGSQRQQAYIRQVHIGMQAFQRYADLAGIKMAET